MKTLIPSFTKAYLISLGDSVESAQHTLKNIATVCGISNYKSSCLFQSFKLRLT